jgi:uncharacterized protein (DUF2141 family)
MPSAFSVDLRLIALKAEERLLGYFRSFDSGLKWGGLCERGYGMGWTFLLGLACGVAFGGGQKAGAPLELSVEVQGVRSDSGNVLFLLFDKKKGFPSESKHAIQALSVPAKAPKVLGVFKNLAAGTYAVFAMHDEDGDGELDSNFLGIPREGVGVSRDAKGSFGPPSYRDAELEVLQNLTIQIQLKYL